MNEITIRNATDVGRAEAGEIPEQDVRSITVGALVDTGATMLAIPHELLRPLGLTVRRRSTVKLADGTTREVGRVGVHIEILGRDMWCDALVLPRGATALIGQIPLEGLDLVVDPKSREVRVNPASPDTPLLDLRFHRDSGCGWRCDGSIQVDDRENVRRRTVLRRDRQCRGGRGERSRVGGGAKPNRGMGWADG